MKMKLSELIAILAEAYEINGEMDVVGMVDCKEYPELDINCPDEESPLYLELYRD